MASPKLSIFPYLIPNFTVQLLRPLQTRSFLPRKSDYAHRQALQDDAVGAVRGHGPISTVLPIGGRWGSGEVQPTFGGEAEVL